MNPQILAIQDYIISKGYQPCRYVCKIAAVRNGKAAVWVKIPDSGVVSLNTWKELETKLNQYLNNEK